jgi:hypothetical protein
MWFIKLLQKRPSDLTIRLGRIIFGLLLVWSLYYNLIYNVSGLDTIDKNFFWVDLNAETLEYVKYFFISVWIVPIIMGSTNICLLKKKYVRIIQVIFWILLFYIANQVIPFDVDALDVDVLIWFMWVLPLVAWITGKCITTGCMKYMEKITKVRI